MGCAETPQQWRKYFIQYNTFLPGGAKLVSCPERHLTSVRPWAPLGHSGHVAEPLKLEFLCSEKWLDIQGFMKFTIAHLIAKSNAKNSSQKSHLYRSYLRSRPFSHYPRFITKRGDRSKDWFENWQLFRVCNLPFRSHGAPAALLSLYQFVHGISALPSATPT